MSADKEEKKSKERISIFIDGSNFYNSTAVLNIVGKVNFQKLLDELTGNRELVNAYYYVAPLDFETNPKKYWKHQRFLAMLKEIPKFNVVLCTLKKIKKKDGSFEFVVKGDDARLIHDFIVGAYENLYDTAIIVSGDEDFAPMIKTAQRLGKKVENAYFSSSSSYALRRVCDQSIHLNKIISKILN